DVADGAVRAPPHLFQMEFFDPRFIWGDGRAFDANASGLDRLGGVDRDLVVCRVAILDREIVVLEIDVQIGMDKLVANQLPDDARHLVAVEFDDRIRDLDLGYLRRTLVGGRRATCGRRAPIASAPWRAKACSTRAARGV